MKSSFFVVITLFLPLFLSPVVSCTGRNPPSETVVPVQDEGTKGPIAEEEPLVPPGAQALLDAYPGALAGYENNKILWRDGSAMVWDDGVKKSFSEKLNNPDLEDQMSQIYGGPFPGTGGGSEGGGEDPGLPAVNQDPGRIRREAFFLKLYGEDESLVRQHLVPVTWPGGVTLWIHERAAEAFSSVAAELKELMANHPEKDYGAFLNPPGGTFVWRRIAGTSRLSTHSFGIAVDINPALSDYWRWQTTQSDAPQVYRNRIPQEIVAIFEAHGFIWGGRWYHYDTMHFEYRPELMPGKAQP